MQSIKHQVKQYVLDNFIMGAGRNELRDDDSFMAGHIIDSTGILELTSFLEQAFGIKVEDEELVPDNLDSLNCIEQYVQRKLAAGVV
jgi:acyl carrier protein